VRFAPPRKRQDANASGLSAGGGGRSRPGRFNRTLGLMIYCFGVGSAGKSAVRRESNVSQLCRLARILRPLLLAGVAAMALSACASNRAPAGGSDYTALAGGKGQVSLADLTERYRRNPRDRAVVIQYASALRAVG